MRVVPVLVVLVVVIALLAGLSRVKELGPRSCVQLAMLMTVSVGVLVWAGHGRGVALLSVMVLMPVAVFVGLFTAWRALSAQQALGFVVVAGRATRRRPRRRWQQC